VSVTVTVKYLVEVAVVSAAVPLAVRVFTPIDCDVAVEATFKVDAVKTKPVVAAPVPCCHTAAVAAAVAEAVDEEIACVVVRVVVEPRTPPPVNVTTEALDAVAFLMFVQAVPLAKSDVPSEIVASPPVTNRAAPVVTARSIVSFVASFVALPAASLRVTLRTDPTEPPVAIVEPTDEIAAVAGAPAVVMVTTAFLSPAVNVELPIDTRSV
jgi:hypothetical protein